MQASSQVAESLHRICSDAGRLLRVREALLESGYNLVSDVELKFEHMAVVISADGEYDTVAVNLSALPQGKECKPSVHPSWHHCINKQLQWAWVLTNQQGYMDGIRFEFFDPDSPDTVTMELIASASSFELFSLSREA